MKNPVIAFLLQYLQDNFLPNLEYLWKQHSVWLGIKLCTQHLCNF